MVSPRVTRQSSNAHCLKSSTIDTWSAKLPTQTRTTSVADRRAMTTKQKGGKNTNSGKQDRGRGPRTAAKVKSVSFLSYNICGLRSKINDAVFISYVNKFDFVCLLETFVEDLKTNVFYNFIHFVSPAVKLSRAGRRSGGVLLLIKKIIGDYVQEISLGVENIITMKLSRRLFGISADVFLICVYSAPLKSPSYSKSNFNNGISVWSIVCSQ